VDRLIVTPIKQFGRLAQKIFDGELVIKYEAERERERSFLEITRSNKYSSLEVCT